MNLVYGHWDWGARAHQRDSIDTDGRHYDIVIELVTPEEYNDFLKDHRCVRKNKKDCIYPDQSD